MFRINVSRYEDRVGKVSLQKPSAKKVIAW